MRIPGGIRVRIALAVVGIVAGALGAAYMIVVPSLERRLVDARLETLQRLAVPLAAKLTPNRYQWQVNVESFAVATGARVVAFDVLTKAVAACPSGAARVNVTSWGAGSRAKPIGAAVSVIR